MLRWLVPHRKSTILVVPTQGDGPASEGRTALICRAPASLTTPIGSRGRMHSAAACRRRAQVHGTVLRIPIGSTSGLLKQLQHAFRALPTVLRFDNRPSTAESSMLARDGGGNSITARGNCRTRRHNVRAKSTTSTSRSRCGIRCTLRAKHRCSGTRRARSWAWRTCPKGHRAGTGSP